MNLLVCIKQVPASSKVEVDPETGVLLRNGVDSKMNPYDLYALETALQLREAHDGSVTVLSMGPGQAQRIIREAYSMGADAGALLSDRRFGGADVLATGYALSQGVRKLGSFDVILCGKQTTDGDTAQVGPELAEFLGIPSVSNVSAITAVEEDALVVEMDMPDDIETVRITFPCLLSVEKGICSPRLPSYRRKRETASRPVPIFTLDEMEDKEEKHYGLSGSPTQVRRIFPPEPNNRRELWRGTGGTLSDDLYRLLTKQKFV